MLNPFQEIQPGFNGRPLETVIRMDDAFLDEVRQLKAK